MRTTTLRLCLLAAAAAACGHAQARVDTGGALAFALAPALAPTLAPCTASIAPAASIAPPVPSAAHTGGTVPARPTRDGATALADTAWNPVDSATLAQARAGFSTPDGLIVSLGIDKLVSINGNIVTHTSFQIADLSSISSEEMAQTRAALSSLKLVQNGGDNIYLANLSPMTGTVIQNSLDQQSIRSETVINASVIGTDLLKTLNFQSSLGVALANAVGAH
ncbi:MAG: hypothetical protein V4582_13060 [Pseudomonadota bacterium]